MSTVYLILMLAGAIPLIVGSGLMILAGWWAGEKIAWQIQWTRGNRRDMQTSVDLGWQTGAPPEGVWVLVREHANDLIHQRDHLNASWAVMIRRGDRCITESGGFSTHVNNITGWLPVHADPHGRLG